MALAKAVWFGVILLVISYTLVQPGFRHSVSIFSQELMGMKASNPHLREKRQSPKNITDYEFQAVLNVSDPRIVQLLLHNFSFPIKINGTIKIYSLDTTTVCSPNITGYKCMCEKSFAWSYKNCIRHKVCDAIVGDTCGCINDLPADYQFCQLNSSKKEIQNLTTQEAMAGDSTTEQRTEPGEILTEPSVNFLIKEKFKLKMDFEISFNNQGDKVYKDVYDTVKTSYTKYMSEDCAVQNLTFSKGSTIIEYTLTTSSYDSTKAETARNVILKQLSTIYPVEFPVITDLLTKSEELNPENFPQFLMNLSDASANLTDEIAGSPYIIHDIVRILLNVANASYSFNIPIQQDCMKNILITAGSLTLDDAKDSWETLNNPNTGELKGNIRLGNTSSSLLYSLELITARLVNKSFNIATPHIHLNKTIFINTFSGDFNSSVEVDILETVGRSLYITIITFASMDNVLPARDKSNSLSKVINGKVVLLRPEINITNVSLTFDILNDILENPKCVFWDYNLFEGLGGWSDEGCMLMSNENGTIGCNCNHTTSFSILMSPHNPDHSELDYITSIGVGFSIASLILCLIIEAIIWKTIGNMISYFRHISIINIAVSLLIANICFIIGMTIPKTKDAPECTSITFFIHFFYLALFFWMLASALLLLYCMVTVFDGGLSKMSMLAIGFSLGYGAPLIIATITIAVTAPSKEYIRDHAACWLNWDESKALLGFVIPALLIAAVNLIILIVVISKMLMRRASVKAAQVGERHVLMVITRSLAVLTPFLGLTWGLGYGTMVVPKNRGIHIAFAFFNSLQGFFILMFGTLSDKNARSAITMTFSRQNEENVLRKVTNSPAMGLTR